METTDRIEVNKGELYAALSAAQAEIRGALKDSSNPFFKSKYADLASVLDAIREPFAKNGLCLSQLTEPMEGGLLLVTIIGHKSGAELISRTPVPLPEPNKPQATGSSLSYYRRYAAAAIASVAQVDDDAEAATGRGIGYHSPLGDVVKTDYAEEIAGKFKAALKEGPEAIQKVHKEANEKGEEDYRAAWSFLSSSERSAIKKALGK